LSGVQKEDFGAHPFSIPLKKRSYGGSYKIQKSINEAREDARKIADELVEWYRESGKSNKVTE